MNAPFVIVGGMPGLQATLERTGVFASVSGRGSTREIIEMFTGPEVQGRSAEHTLFIFSDTIVENNPEWPLAQIIRVLSSNGYKVIVVPRTAKGRELAQKYPSVGMLPVPLTLGEVLYAVTTFGYVMPDNLPGMFDQIDLDNAAPRPAAETPKPTSANPFANTTPAAPAPAPGGWSVPVVAPEPEPAFTAAPARGPVPPTPTAPAPAPTPAAPAARPAAFGGGARPAAFGAGPGDDHTQGPSGFQAPAAPAQEQPAAWSAPGGWSTPATGPATEPAQWNAPAVPAGGRPSFGATAHNTWGGPALRDGGHYQPQSQQRRGYVITVAVSKGGAGKSSLALNLSAFLAMRMRLQGKTVCVIDANFQQADLGKYLDVYTPNINTIANNPTLLNPDRILEGLVHKAEFNLYALLGPATPDEGNPLNIDVNLYNEIIELLKQHFDYLIIDTPVAEKYHDIFSKFALPQADYVIVPVAPNYTTLHNADNWLNSAVVAPVHAGGAGVDRNRIGILLNRAEDEIGCSEDDVRRTMASWNFIGAIRESKEWKASNNRNELIAPRAFGELLEAFSEVMYAATGERILIENMTLTEKKKGLLGSLGGLFGRRK